MVNKKMLHNWALFSLFEHSIHPHNIFEMLFTMRTGYNGASLIKAGGKQGPERTSYTEIHFA